MRKRYDKNPFIDKTLDITPKSKPVRVSVLGKGDEVLVNTKTGEQQGTHVITYKKVDSKEFIKLFTQNIALTFDLGSAGLKALNVLIHTVQYTAIQRDIVMLDKYALQDFINNHSTEGRPLKTSESTFYRGLVELEEAQIIARHLRVGSYYLNPEFIFNGDRIAFTQVIEREDKK